jgi:hypothetical protein
MTIARQTKTEPVRKRVVVNATPDEAFRVFTDGMDAWWSREHHWGGTPLKRQVLEAKGGGRWYSVSEDETEHDLGRVVLCEPPSKIVIACLQLTLHGGREPDTALETEIEVTFAKEGDLTLVHLEHRHLERYGEQAWAVRGHLDAVIGWRATLDDFARSFANAGN